MPPSFSVIIPTHNRPQVVGAVESVVHQYCNGPREIIVVDDGSTDGSINRLKMAYGNIGLIRLLEHGENKGKVAARNTGMRAAKNEWICWLDSDDEYHSHYFEHFTELIEKNPDTKIFTCGAAVYDHKTKNFWTRQAFVPQKGEEFPSGKIGSGSFVFHRSLVFELPESKVAYGQDGSFSHLAQESFAGIRKLYGQSETGQWKPLGNPFGDDYVMFYGITRNEQPIGLNLPLYLQNVRHV